MNKVLFTNFLLLRCTIMIVLGCSCFASVLQGVPLYIAIALNILLALLNASFYLNLLMNPLPSLLSLLRDMVALQPEPHHIRWVHLEANIFKVNNSQFLAKIITLLQSFIIWGTIIYYIQGLLPYDMVNNSDSNFIKAFLTLFIFYFKLPLLGILQSINLEILNEGTNFKFHFSKHFCEENYKKFFTLYKIINFTISTLLGLGILKFLNINLDFIWLAGIGEIIILLNFTALAQEYFSFKIFNPILKNKIMSIFKLEGRSSLCTKTSPIIEYNKPLRSASAGGTGLSAAQRQIADEEDSKNLGFKMYPEDVDKHFLREVTSFIKVFNEENKKIAEMLQNISNANVHYSDETHNIYFVLLKNHSNALEISYSNRGGWVNLCTKYFSPEVQSKLVDMEAKRDMIREDYLSKVEKLGNNKASFKEFFTLTNNYRNKLNKELNSAEEIVHLNLRETTIYKNSQLKKLINSDYIEAKKTFKNQDTILKKKFEEKLFTKKT